jgi:hypothetical protein
MNTTQRALPQTSLTRLLLFAGPLLWAVLVLFHPNPSGDAYEGIADDVDRWLFVHIGQLVLTPLLVLAVWRLLDGLPSMAAMVSRAALVVWAVFFSAYDSVQGVATGILVRHANDLAGEKQSAVAGAIDYVVNEDRLGGNVSLISFIGQGSWILVAIAAAVALYKAGAGKVVAAATLLSALFAIHTAPAAAGLVALFLAGIFRERQRTGMPTRWPEGGPVTP